MQNHRKKTEILPSDQLKKQQQMFLKNKNSMDVNNANNTAFKLANQVAESEKNNNFLGSQKPDDHLRNNIGAHTDFRVNCCRHTYTLENLF